MPSTMAEESPMLAQNSRPTGLLPFERLAPLDGGAPLPRTARPLGSRAGDGRREKTLIEQKHPQIDPFFSVELQDGNGGAANRGTCGKDRACPLEVPLPSVASRMKQLNNSAGLWIHAG